MPRHKVLRSPRSARKERRKKSKKILLLAFFLVAAVATVAYGFSRQEFRIVSVEVIGSKRVPEDLIRERVREKLSGTIFGFIPRSHTLLYPKTAIKESLMKEFAVFSGISLSLQSLSTLRVFVHEREPQALWCISEKDCFMIDEMGFVFAPADSGTERMYYRLGKNSTESPIGREMIDREKFAALLLFLKRLEEADMPPEEVLFKEQNELEVALLGGTRLLLREGEYRVALTNLETLMRQDDLLPKKGGALSVVYIDLRYGNKIYFKPR